MILEEKIVHTSATDFGLSKLLVFDNLLTTQDLSNLHDALLQAGYTKSAYDRTDTFDIRHWSTDIDLEIAEAMPVYEPTISALETFRPENTYKLYSAYVKASSYGDMLYSHFDCEPAAGNVTATWFICKKWSHEWGGESLFFDDSKDARAVVSPRAGRLAVFDGDILHVDRAPNRICFSARYTLTLKFRSSSTNSIQ